MKHALFFVLILVGFFSKSQDVIEIQPITNKILLVHINEGHTDYNGVSKTGSWESAGNNIFYGNSLNLSAATITGSYTLWSFDDNNYGQSINPEYIGYKAKGTHYRLVNSTARANREWWIYLKLPMPLTQGKNYTLSILNKFVDNSSSFQFKFDAFNSLSPTIHVNQIGFVPNSPKYAYLSQWMGNFTNETHINGALDLSDYTSKKFYIYDIVNQRIAREYTGGISLQKAQGICDSRFQFSLASIWQCDFSDFNVPGKYMVVVEELGCSYPFEIQNDVYRDAFYTAMRGIYYQRQGIEKFCDDFDGRVFPRDHHPDDNNFVYYDSLSTNDVEGLSANGTTVPAFTFNPSKKVNVWGHYFDAGDWDMTNNHWKVPLTMMLLYDFKPLNFGDNDTHNRYKLSSTSPQINESGNGLPDLLDEAKWLADFYKRTKYEIMKVGGTGGLPGYIGVDAGSTSFPSWADKRLQGVKAEMPKHTYYYATIAAYYAYCLKKYNLNGGAISQTEIDSWQTEAISAYNWAVAKENKVTSARTLAAVALYLLTDNTTYQTDFVNGWNTFPHFGCWGGPTDELIASAIYSVSCASKPTINATHLTTVRNYIIKYANLTSSNIETNDYRMGGIEQFQTNTQNLKSTPRTIFMAAAYQITGDSKYLNAIYNTVSYFLGANQLNEVTMTGIGDKTENSVFLPNAWYLLDYNSKAYTNPILPGFSAYGGCSTWDLWTYPLGSNYYGQSTAIPIMSTPSSMSSPEWPMGEKRFPNRYSISGSEFTIHENNTWLIFSYGYLCSNASTYTPNLRPTVSINLTDNQDIERNSIFMLTSNTSSDTQRVKYYYDWHYIGESKDAINGFPFKWAVYNSSLKEGDISLITAIAYDDKGLESMPSSTGERNVKIVSNQISEDSCNCY